MKYTEANFLMILKKYLNYPEHLYSEGHYSWLLERLLCENWVYSRTMPVEEEDLVRKAYCNAYEVHGHFNFED